MRFLTSLLGLIAEAVFEGQTRRDMRRACKRGDHVISPYTDPRVCLRCWQTY